MGRPEGKVEDYLTEQVEAHGGTCEKFVTPGKRGPPDRLVCWRHCVIAGIILPAIADFVETKADGKEPEDHQLRDHERRRKMGFRVWVIDTRERVDQYIAYRQNRWVEMIG